ncbi:hypothetical protein F5B22DRAFT_415411 [Xylaria bambusicola]|uniref:uncharacterized protein n=1 Tax=Xylaria bambusicola TaxID=326684 RepID=UPI0020077312|nr:uncharacterized protein F5B22DRAFT_415411 [Xylaria bambusicola]KAI0523757.1 hypothetical protein F5B22DRAFT_415411 [Xylaria bambusicola]
MRPSHHQITTLLLLLLLLLPISTASSPERTNSIPEKTPDPPLLLPRQQTMSTDSPCADSEGQWNCMTSSFQRCGSGRWSEVQQCAFGTQCSPAGLTYEFHVDYADGAAPPGTSGAEREMLVDRWVVVVSGLLGLLALFL